MIPQLFFYYLWQLCNSLVGCVFTNKFLILKHQGDKLLFIYLKLVLVP